MNIIIIILFIALLIFSFYICKPQHQFTITDFMHELPKELYPDLVAKYGQPDIRTKGVIGWYNKDMYTRILLKDEQVANCKAEKYYDFLYFVIHVYIPKDKVCQIKSLSNSVLYDSLKRELIVRSNSIKTNVAIMYLVLLVATDQITITTALTEYNLIIKQPPNFVQELETKVKQMQTILNTTAPPIAEQC